MGGGTEKERMGDGGETKQKNQKKRPERESRLTAGAVSVREGRERPDTVNHHGRRLMYAVNHYGRHLIYERYMSARQK